MCNIPLKGEIIEDVVNLFIEENVLLYHGIHETRKTDYTLLEKTNYCIEGKNDVKLSCCSLKSGDKLFQNLFSPYGLILKPNEILGCHKSGLGTEIFNGVATFDSIGENPTLNRCKQAILERKDTDMNEFVVNGYEIIATAVYYEYLDSKYAKEVIDGARNMGITKLIVFGNGSFTDCDQIVKADDIYGN